MKGILGIKEKPIYQLYDEIVQRYMVCRCKLYEYGFTMQCGKTLWTTKEMEAHIRHDHPKQITETWR